MTKAGSATGVDEALSEAMGIDGASAAMIVDYDSGMALGTIGGGVDLDVAAAGNTEVVRAKMATMNELGLNDEIEDILITLGKAYHIIRPLPDTTLFFYIVLSRKANLAMARHKLTGIVSKVRV
jgi:predicted regulator of Ras-like GTPase activity (Roadblock/LC7/MglB family)